MKCRVKKDKGSGAHVLVVELDKDDRLDYAAAERLRKGDLRAFLPFSYERKGSSYEFRYRIGNCVSMEELIKRPLQPGMLGAMLRSLLVALQECERAGLSRTRIVFEDERVFFDHATQSLQLSYFPLSTYSGKVGDSLFLAHICERLQTPMGDEDLKRATYDFAKRSPIITALAFEAFLTQQGVMAQQQGFARDGFVHHTTSSLDTRSSFGWDFVKEAQAQAGKDDKRTLFADAQSKEVRLVQARTGKVFLLSPGAYSVGRARNCSICLESSAGVSRLHAEILVLKDGCYIRDKGSMNGTIVGGTRLEQNAKSAVRPGESFYFGIEEFYIE